MIIWRIRVKIIRTVLCCLVFDSCTHTTVLRPFFRDHPGEPVPEENFWTLWCKGRLTEADTPTIRLGATATPSGLTSAHLHHPNTVQIQNQFVTCRLVQAKNRNRGHDTHTHTREEHFLKLSVGLGLVFVCLFRFSILRVFLV